MQTRRQFLKNAIIAVPSLIAIKWSLADDVLSASNCVSESAVESPQGVPSVPDGVEYVPRYEWSGRLSPKMARMRPSGGFDRLTVHHWGVESRGMGTSKAAVAKRLDGVMNSHISRNYGDIGYHFLIDPSGRVWEGRSLEYEGAHVCGENKRNMGVMLLGNFQEENPTSDHLNALECVIKWAKSLYPITNARIFGHCDLASSCCPGRLLYPHIEKLKEVFE